MRESLSFRDGCSQHRGELVAIGCGKVKLSLILPVNKRAVTLTAASSHLRILKATSLRLKQLLRLEWQRLERSWILGDTIGLLNLPVLKPALPLDCQVT